MKKIAIDVSKNIELFTDCVTGILKEGVRDITKEGDYTIMFNHEIHPKGSLNAPIMGVYYDEKERKAYAIDADNAALEIATDATTREISMIALSIMEGDFSIVDDFQPDDHA